MEERVGRCGGGLNAIGDRLIEELDRFGVCKTCEYWKAHQGVYGLIPVDEPSPLGDCGHLMSVLLNNGLKMAPGYAAICGIPTHETFGCRLWRRKA